MVNCKMYITLPTIDHQLDHNLAMFDVCIRDNREIFLCLCIHVVYWANNRLFLLIHFYVSDTMLETHSKPGRGMERKRTKPDNKP
jgi:hypothetical protein